MSGTQRGFDLALAERELRGQDPRLAPWFDRLGPITPDPRWREGFDTVDALARAILYQQLSGKAAATIVARVEAASGRRRLTAARLDALDDATLRACGVSRNKLLALRDLCRHARARRVPGPRRLLAMEDEAIVEALTAVRGIGRWTVEMLLIFRLGRPDVLPHGDLGIQRGLQRLCGLSALPSPARVAEFGAGWAPWRSLASLLLWRIAGAT